MSAHTGVTKPQSMRQVQENVSSEMEGSSNPKAQQAQVQRCFNKLTVLWFSLSADSKFTQQELPACKPLLTPGIVIAALRHRHPVCSHRLAAACGLTGSNADVGFIQNSRTDKTCTVTINVPKYMKSPIHVYYLIDDTQTNYCSLFPRYVRSQGQTTVYKSVVHLISDCVPEGKTADGAPIVPCGLDIAWKSDKNNKFSNNIYPSNFQKGSLIGGARRSHCLMRTAAPTFRKLYGRIEKDINANDNVTVVIQNNYNTYSFGGSKLLVLSTASWIGGKTISL
ncbi:hypothetical protein ZWY2020_014965, partial [Hordeum vulgare]